MASATPPPSDRTTASCGRWAVHGFTLAVFALWWGYAQTVPAYQLPDPLAVLQRMGLIVTDATLAQQLLASLAHVLAAIALGFVLGCALAALAAYVPASRLLIDGMLVPFLSAFAGIGWLFLGMLWFGLTSVTVVFAVTMVLTPFVTVNVRTGFAELDGELQELGRSFTHDRVRHEVLLVVPQLLPYLFAALRTSFGVAWKVVLVAELFGGSSGAGYLVNLARQQFDTETIFAVIAFIVVFVLASEHLLFHPVQRLLSKRFSRE